MRLAFLAAAALSLTLTGCITPTAKPQPSQAILEARARAQAAKSRTTDPCGRWSFATATPVAVAFPYDRPALTPEAEELLDHAAVWLVCHPDVWVSLSAVKESHGTPEAQTTLANARVAAVRARLTAGGVHPGRLLTYKPRGESLTVEARGRGW